VYREEKLPPEVRYWPTSPHLRLCTVLGAICQEQGWAGSSISTVGTIMAPGAGKRSGVRSVWVLEFAHDQLLEVCESALVTALSHLSFLFMPIQLFKYLLEQFLSCRCLWCWRRNIFNWLSMLACSGYWKSEVFPVRDILIIPWKHGFGVPSSVGDSGNWNKIWDQVGKR